MNRKEEDIMPLGSSCKEKLTVDSNWSVAGKPCLMSHAYLTYFKKVMCTVASI